MHFVPSGSDVSMYLSLDRVNDQLSNLFAFEKEGCKLYSTMEETDEECGILLLGGGVVI